jgi:hypothetical protein
VFPAPAKTSLFTQGIRSQWDPSGTSAGHGRTVSRLLGEIGGDGLVVVLVPALELIELQTSTIYYKGLTVSLGGGEYDRSAVKGLCGGGASVEMTPTYICTVNAGRVRTSYGGCPGNSQRKCSDTTKFLEMDFFQ